MANRKKRNPDGSLLSEDIIYNILLWVHVKALLQFKSVCKSWLSLISSRKFIETQLSVSTNDPHFTHHHLLLRVNPYAPNKEIEDNTDLDLWSLSVYSLLNEPKTKAIRLHYPMRGSGYVLGFVRGYCHGLVCLTTIINDDESHELLWNPSTRKSRTLPKLDMFGDYWCRVYGFCYDESNDDYKVYINFENKVSVYSSKSDSWRMIGDFPYEGSLCADGKFANGTIYWVVKRSGMKCNNLESKIIVSLDIKTENFQEILQPEYGKGADYWTLNTFGESLSIFCTFETHAHFGVLKECGLEKSWTKLFTIPYTKEQTWYSYPDPLSISVNGDIILNFGSIIKLYNSKDNTFKKLFHGLQRLHGIQCYHLSAVDTYVESLVSPCL